MGTIKNAVYKVDNGTDFDEIHFKTKAAQVFCNDGKTVEAQLAEMRNMNVTVINRATNLAGGQLITLGFKPRYVRIRALISPANADSTAINYDSDGVAIIDSNGAISYGDIYKYGSATAVSNLLSSAIVYLHSGTSYNAAKIGVISDTGITLDWSLSGAIPTGTIRMLLEAW